MFFPYSTDAPIYHLPIGTVGLILLNVLAFLGVESGALPSDPVTGDPWILAYGAGLHPLQWFCSAFAHEGLGHLLGNMLFLWVFGLVVEGKLGVAKFLPIYLVIAVGQSAFEQTVMLGASGGGSLGASSAIYGIMAIAAVWAPDNSVSFFYWFGLLWRGVFDVPILGLAVFYVSIDLGFALLGGVVGSVVTSGLLHVMGVCVGAPIGVLLLKRGVVDCEGWDIFSHYAGGPSKKQLAKEKADAERQERQRSQRTADRQSQVLSEAPAQIDKFLESGHPTAALALYRKVGSVGDGLRLDAPRLRRLIRGLQSNQQWAELAPLMCELIDADPAHANVTRLRLAQVAVVKLERPGRAMELLEPIDLDSLSHDDQKLAKQVLARARRMQADGVVELDDRAW